MNPMSLINDLIAYFNKNRTICIIGLLIFPIACAMIYGSLKSFWQKHRYKKQTAAVYDLIQKADPNQPAPTTDNIAKTLDVPKGDVISICVENPNIMDAGKRQRSWKLSPISQVSNKK